MSDLWNILQGYLGSQAGVVLRPVSDEDNGGVPAVIPTGRREDRSFLLLQDEGSFEYTPSCLLRLSSVTGKSAAQVRQETSDLLSGALPEEGTTRPAVGSAASGAKKMILPPLYYCRQKGTWIGVVCPGCSGIPSDLGGDDQDRCQVCGSVNMGDKPTGQDMSSPMEALWTAVQQGLGPAKSPAAASVEDGRIPGPHCLSCERRSTCFSPAGSRVEPRGALDALTPLMGAPWVGSLVTEFDLPLAAWLRMAKDPGIDPASIAPGSPTAVQERIADRANDQHGRLVPAEFRERALGESLLLRLEALRQLLTGIRGVHAGLQHPHLDIRPESIWVRPGKHSSLAPSLWNLDLQLIDLAPCSIDQGKYVQAPDFPSELTPPKAATGGDDISGILVPRGETVEEEGRTGVKFLFLPQGECEDPPGENEPVTLAMVQDDSESHPFQGRVEVNLKDVYRLVIYAGDIPVEKFDEELKGLGSQAVLRKVAAEGQHAVDPDLYATGTIWLSLLRWDAEGLDRAAVLRDTMLETLEKEDALRGDHGVAERICLTTAKEQDDLFRHQFDAAGAEGSASMGGKLLGKCLWLGLRMCGALPEIFNGEAAGVEGAQPVVTVLNRFIRETEVLQEEARYLMLGRSSAREEILSVIRSFQSDLLEA